MSVSRLSKQSIQAGFPKQQTIWDQSTQTASMDALGVVTLGSTQTSITFSSIPSTYTHLQIRALTVTNVPSGSGVMYFNGDSTNTNYRNHYLYGSGTSAAANDGGNHSYAPEFVGGGATTSPGASIIDILDYTNTNKYKTTRELGGYDANGSGYITLSSNLWMNNAAITSISFNITSWLAGTSFALYGVK